MSHLMIFGDDPELSAEVAAALPPGGFRATEVGLSAGAAALDRERPALAIVADAGTGSARTAGADLLRKAAGLGIPVVWVVGRVADLPAMADRLDAADDWVSREALGSELAARVARLLKRRGGADGKAVAKSSLPIDPQFFALVVHDLRTPLNVIGLSLRMISQAIPRGDADLEEDLRFVEENFKQIERMLTQLSEYYRLFENDGPITSTPFSPRRLVEELIEYQATKANAKRCPVVIEDGPTCPAEVALDPLRARIAIQYALVNATAACNGGPIRLRMGGGPDRWVTEVAIDHPPPSSVQSVALSPRSFERLCGFAAERRGMDLAIAARVSELFGGSARLDVVENEGSTVVLDWPARLAGS